MNPHKVKFDSVFALWYILFAGEQEEMKIRKSLSNTLVISDFIEVTRKGKVVNQ